MGAAGEAARRHLAHRHARPARARTDRRDPRHRLFGRGNDERRRRRRGEARPRSFHSRRQFDGRLGRVALCARAARARRCAAADRRLRHAVAAGGETARIERRLPRPRISVRPLAGDAGDAADARRTVAARLGRERGHRR